MKERLGRSFSFFQRVRGNEKEEWGWYLSASKVLMLDDNGAPVLAITGAHPSNEYKSITSKLAQLISEREKVKPEISKFILLTKREKGIIKLLCVGHNSPFIAEALLITPSTVSQHIKNIKNKLNIVNLPELILFAQAFDLID